MLSLIKLGLKLTLRKKYVILDTYTCKQENLYFHGNLGAKN